MINLNPLISESESSASPSPRNAKRPKTTDKVAELVKPKQPEWSSNFSVVEPEKKIPPTPIKSFVRKERPTQGVRCLFHEPAKIAKRVPENPKVISPFLTLHTELQKGKFCFNQEIEEPSEVKFLGRGNYCAAYEILNTPNIIKAHHGGTDYRFSYKILHGFLEQTLANYDEVLKHGLPVAELINRETVLETCYYIQRKIPHAINPLESKQLEQISKFFEIAVKHNILMDLHPENFRVTEEGTVVLIDFVEEPSELFFFINDACREWTELLRTHNFSLEQARVILSSFTSSFLGTHADYPTSWLENILTT